MGGTVNLDIERKLLRAKQFSQFVKALDSKVLAAKQCPNQFRNFLNNKEKAELDAMLLEEGND